MLTLCINKGGGEDNNNNMNAKITYDRNSLSFFSFQTEMEGKGSKQTDPISHINLPRSPVTSAAALCVARDGDLSSPYDHWIQ